MDAFGTRVVLFSFKLVTILGERRPNPLVDATVIASLCDSNCNPDSSAPMVALSASMTSSMIGLSALLDSSMLRREIRIDVTFFSDCCHIWAVERSVKMAGDVVPAS